MKNSTKDQVNGNFHRVIGTIREVAGKLTRNPELEAGGRFEKIAGIVQERIGQVRNGTREAGVAEFRRYNVTQIGK